VACFFVSSVTGKWELVEGPWNRNEWYGGASDPAEKARRQSVLEAKAGKEAIDEAAREVEEELLARSVLLLAKLAMAAHN
jgi:hypothetical protein